MQNRPPIVVILGHVDHGKTTLLDFLRKSNIASGEVGGITQSTRAFQVGGCTFIDTPGHAAFSKMRMRGNNLADLAILIVAADDGVMPQTTESAKLLLANNTSFIVAINKTDLPGMNIQKIYTQLSEIGVLVEGYGGTVPVVSISAKTGVGIPELLEMLNLVSEMNPPQADPDGNLEAVVLESRLDPKRGAMAIVVVKNGTLAKGSPLFTNHGVGKIKAIYATTGELVDSAGPSIPVEIFGLSEVIAVGKTIGSQSVSHPVLADAPKIKNVNGVVRVILKADVLGSLEAIIASLDPQIEIALSGTGDISESDILSAAPQNIPIIGFNVRVSSSAGKLAETEKVKIKSFEIIYELLDYLKVLVQKTLNPRAHEKILGEAEITAEFNMNSDHIAGCKCLTGQINKTNQLHLSRNNEIIQDIRFRSLRSAKSDVNLVKSGIEFGAVFSGTVDFRINDRIIAFTIDD
ncbi:MAG: GTP-binding protein [Candidatus Amesbacteria bacterium]|nr:GTP-binding protein [Candidatus Amesbacteria bacterium]